MSLLRRRGMMQANSGTVYPFYSDYPTITEYGTFYFYPQTDDSTITNLFLKIDDTPYNWCGSASKKQTLIIEYTKENIAISQYWGAINWIKKVQESSRFSLKRCAGTENDPSLVVFKVEKIQ